MEQLNVDNAVIGSDTQTEVVDGQGEVISEVVEAVEKDVDNTAETDGTASRQQSQEENAQYAKIRREAQLKAEAKAKEIAQAEIDKVFKEMYAGQINPYTNRPIESKADYDEYKRQYDLEQMGVNPVEQQEFIEKLKREALESDPELKAQNEELEYYRQQTIKAQMESDLTRIKTLDNTVKSLDELGEEFFKLIASGVDAVIAYNAIKASKPQAQPTMGDINSTEPREKDFFTREEVEKMTQEEVRKNFDKIRLSQSKWR